MLFLPVMMDWYLGDGSQISFSLMVIYRLRLASPDILIANLLLYIVLSSSYFFILKLSLDFFFLFENTLSPAQRLPGCVIVAPSRMD